MEGTVDFGGGPLASAGQSDVFAVKLDASGGHVWSRRSGDAMTQFGAAVDATPDGGVILTGSFYGSMDWGGPLLVSAGSLDIYRAKLDAAGNHVWSHGVPNANAAGTSDIGVDASGFMVATGNFYGSIDFGVGLHVSAGDSDAFLVRWAP
jgi:hypothetical protein